MGKGEELHSEERGESTASFRQEDDSTQPSLTASSPPVSSSVSMITRLLCSSGKSPFGVGRVQAGQQKTRFC